MAKRFVDKSGHVFGKLRVLRVAEKSGVPREALHYWVKCLSCGKEYKKPSNALRMNKLGCQQCRNKLFGRGTTHARTHNMTGTTEYNSYRQMLKRCYLPTDKMYYLYGARGIQVCERWRQGFEWFFADMGYRPKGLTLDRIDNDGDYSPENCRWTTPKVQAINRRTTKWVQYDGRTYSIPEFNEAFGFKPYTLGNYVSAHKCSYEEAVRFYMTLREKRNSL